MCHCHCFVSGSATIYIKITGIVPLSLFCFWFCYYLYLDYRYCDIVIVLFLNYEFGLYYCLFYNLYYRYTKKSSFTFRFSAASYLGCWKISLSNLTIPSVEGSYPTLTDNYQGRTGAVRKCADVASIRGYVVFALYDYGMCLTGPNAVRTFSQYGASSDCGYRGKGGTTGVSVYSFQKGMIDVFFLQVYIGSLTPPLCNEVPYVKQENVRSCICVLCVSIFLLFLLFYEYILELFR